MGNKALRLGLALALAAQWPAAKPADACGIKLVVKTSAPHKAIARSSNPSHILLLGSPPARLKRDLVAAGHAVDVAPTVASTTKRTSYALVVADASQADEARAKFPNSQVVVRSENVSAELASIEGRIARRPIRADEGRAVVAARTPRTPVAAGPTTKVVATKPAGEPAPAATPTPAPTESPKPVDVKPAVTPKEPTTVAVVDKPTPPEKPSTAKHPPVAQPAATPSFRREFYFGVGSSSVANKATLSWAVKWLNANPDLSVVVEGYADPTGTPDDNLALGQKRAESVRDLLVGAGVDASRIEVISFGDTKLKYGRSDGRNRRVAIVPKQ